MRPGPPCHLGEAPGYWEAGQWRVHNTSRCADEPLRRYVWIRDECAQSGRGRACVVHDEAAMTTLSNTSVLLLGDSTSAYLLAHACDAFGTATEPFIHVPRHIVNRSRYMHRLTSLDNHRCTLRPNASRHGAGVALGSFSHYGATGPPYWAYAYPLAPWLGQTTLEQVRHDGAMLLLWPRGDPRRPRAN